MSKFPERLKYLREEAGLSIRQLADKFNGKISSSSISSWELGQQIPRFDATIMIAQFFNVTLDYLAGLEDD